jgi:hypothetical protein
MIMRVMTNWVTMKDSPGLMMVLLVLVQGIKTVLGSAVATGAAMQKVNRKTKNVSVDCSNKKHRKRHTV